VEIFTNCFLPAHFIYHLWQRIPIKQITMKVLLFPILKVFETFFGYKNQIVENNIQLAQELEEKRMPPMSGQEIKEYVTNQNK
jgi:hypothetical protein